MFEIKNPSKKIITRYSSINEEQNEIIDKVFNKANELLDLIEQLPNSRRKSIAITKLEECILFTNKCICFGE